MRRLDALVGVLCAAAALRVAVLLAAASSPQRFWSPDDRDYLALADHLHAAYLSGSGALFDLGLKRPPGYPVFIRAIFEALGTHYVAVVAVQAVISVATVAVTYRLARMLLPRPYALVAAAALAIDPASIVFANQMLTESLFTLLLTGSIALIPRSSQARSPVLAGAAGVTLGLSVLVRPVAEYLPLVVVLVLLLIARAERRRTGAIALVFILGFALPSGAWLIRNYAKTGVPIISTIDGHNMLQYRAVGALTESGVPRQRAQHDVLVRLAPHVDPGDNAARVSRAELRVGAAILLEHPLGAFKDWVKGEARLLLGPARSETATLLTGRDTARRAWLRGLILVDQLITIAILLAAGAAIVMLVLRRSELTDLWLLAGSAAYLVVISGGHEAYSRFRVPVTPLLVVLGAAAAAQYAPRRRNTANGVRTRIETSSQIDQFSR